MCIKRPFFDNKKRALYRSIDQEERKEAVEEERKRKERKEIDERGKGKIFSDMIDLIILKKKKKKKTVEWHNRAKHVNGLAILR